MFSEKFRQYYINARSAFYFSKKFRQCHIKIQGVPSIFGKVSLILRKKVKSTSYILHIFWKSFVNECIFFEEFRQQVYHFY